MLDLRIWDALLDVAKNKHGGHVTVMKFTTNWRVSFVTPNERQDISTMASGETFAEAAIEALRAEAVRAEAVDTDIPF